MRSVDTVLLASYTLDQPLEETHTHHTFHLGVRCLAQMINAQGAIWRVSGFLQYLDLWFGFIWRIAHMLCPSAGFPFQIFFSFFQSTNPYRCALLLKL